MAWPNSVYSSQTSFSDAGLLTIYVGTSPKEIPLCLTVVGEELRKLKDKPMDAAALKMHKENLKCTLRLNGDSVENRMSYLARSEMYFGRYLKGARSLCRHRRSHSAAGSQTRAQDLRPAPYEYDGVGAVDE